MSAPTRLRAVRALPGRPAPRPPEPPALRPDLLWLIWLELPAGLLALGLRPLLGAGALAVAAAVIAAIVAAIVWSVRGEP